MAGACQDQVEQIFQKTHFDSTDRRTTMADKVIVSYDGTANENDALAFGALLARAGAEVHIGYVRHSKELVDDQEAQELLERAVRLFDGTLADAHTVTDPSTPEGLAGLAERIGAKAIVFCSDSHTAPGHVTIGNSAERLLNGGSVAVGIAPVGLSSSDRIKRIVAVSEAGGAGGAQATARALAGALGAEVVPVANEQADLLVIDSRAQAQPGRVSISSSAEHLIEVATAAVLVVPNGVSLQFEGAPAVAAA
jgi:nucleotide-binding universal stress UspA family protein